MRGGCVAEQLLRDSSLRLLANQRDVTWGSARAPPEHKKITHQTKAQRANCPMALIFFVHPGVNVVFFTSQVH
jgi:hypothetical protein